MATTDWFSSMVMVTRNGKLRICSYPKDLNKSIRREHYLIPTVEEVVASMPSAKVSSKIHAKSGFRKIKLDYESSILTKFNNRKIQVVAPPVWHKVGSELWTTRWNASMAHEPLWTTS